LTTKPFRQIADNHSDIFENIDHWVSELDEDKRGRMIGDVLDRELMGDEDQEWSDQESRRREEV
jgi:hypothetical protein